MTGPEHYKAAEDCLEKANGNFDYGDPREAFYSRTAQVHATLALAAATAASADSMYQEDAAEWVRVASAHKRKDGSS